MRESKKIKIWSDLNIIKIKIWSDLNIIKIKNR